MIPGRTYIENPQVGTAAEAQGRDGNATQAAPNSHGRDVIRPQERSPTRCGTGGVDYPELAQEASKAAIRLAS